MSISKITIGGTTHDIVANGLTYCICSTAADTVAKEATVASGNFSLFTGATVIVKFTYANSIAAPTLNVNGTGAKPIYRYGTTTASTGTTTTGWVAGAVQMFTYDGTGWIRDYWNNTTYSNASMGSGYATCSTAAATTAKTASLSSYSLTTGGIVSVKFTYDVPASATLNINSKGAKAIYFRGAAITAGVIKAGDTATFIYSSRYHLISIDRWQEDIKSCITGLSASGKTITYTKGDGTTGTITTQDTVYTHPTTSGNKHIPSGGSSGQILRWSADGTAAWGADNNTTYGVVSTTADGLAPKRDGSTTKFLRADGTWAVPPDTNTDTNTTYTFATGDSNGQIKVTPSGGSAQNVSVKGLGTAAYTESSAYATSGHTHSNYLTTSGTAANAEKVGGLTVTDIISQVLEAIGTPVFGTVDENNNIVLTGNLADGTYTLKYENTDGTYAEIGTLDVGETGPAYTNLFDSSTATLNARYSMSSGSINSSATGYVLTDYIPVAITGATPERILRFRGYSNFTDSNAAVCYFLASKNFNSPTNVSVIGMGIKFTNSTIHTDENGDSYIKLACVNDVYDEALVDTAYIRIQMKVSDSSATLDDIQDIIITVDEPIED